VSGPILPRTAARRKAVTARRDPLRTSTRIPTSDSLTQQGDRRFVGDMNPESVFIETDIANVNLTETGRIGVWVRRDQSPVQNSSTGSSPSRYGRLWIFDPTLESFLVPYLEEKCYSLIPTDAELSRSIEIYQKEIFPWFPIIRANELSLSAPPALKLLVSFLVDRLYPRDEVNTGTEILSAIITLLDFRVIEDNLLLVQANIIVSFFAEGLIGSDRAQEYASVAHHHCLYRALHLDDKHEDLEKVFLCVWAIDRLNTMIHGKAILLHERDGRRNLVASMVKQNPPFQLLLRLGLELDRVIDLYRPSGSLSRGNSILPSFESLKGISGITNEGSISRFLGK
jgi:hypothetical protein